LRDKQFAKSTADDVLFRRIAKQQLGYFHNGDHESSEKTMAELMQDCQNARNVYGPAEDDLNTLEDQLSEKEFSLTRLEESIYSRGRNMPNTSFKAPAIPALQNISAPTSDDQEMGSDNNDHPLLSEFLSIWGDLDIVKERRSDFEDRKESLEMEKDSRARFNLLLDPEDQEWLDNSQSILQGLDQEIAKLEQEFARLKQECLLQGLVDEDGEPTDFRTQEQSTFQDDQDVDPKGEVSEYVKYPSLLPHPASKHDHHYCNQRQEPDKLPDKAPGMVNWWLLDRLRTSALDVHLLVSIFEHKVGKPDERWERAVLAVWYQDGTSRGGSTSQTKKHIVQEQSHPHAPKRRQYHLVTKQ